MAPFGIELTYKGKNGEENKKQKWKERELLGGK